MSSTAPTTASSAAATSARASCARRQAVPTSAAPSQRRRAPPRPPRCRRPAASARVCEERAFGAPARSARATAAAEDQPGADRRAAISTTTSTRQAWHAVPQRTSDSHRPVFKLKRGVPSIRRARCPSFFILSPRTGLSFPISCRWCGPPGRPVSRSWWRRACAITRRGSRPKASAPSRWRTSGAASARRDAPGLCPHRADRARGTARHRALHLVADGHARRDRGEACGAKRLVLAPIGLGHLWIKDDSSSARAAVARCIIGKWLNGPRTRYLFENPDDPAEFGLDPASRR